VKSVRATSGMFKVAAHTRQNRESDSSVFDFSTRKGRSCAAWLPDQNEADGLPRRTAGVNLETSTVRIGSGRYPAARGILNAWTNLELDECQGRLCNLLGVFLRTTFSPLGLEPGEFPGQRAGD
jgi:hypothetical protein